MPGTRVAHATQVKEEKSRTSSLRTQVAHLRMPTPSGEQGIRANALTTAFKASELVLWAMRAMRRSGRREKETRKCNLLRLPPSLYPRFTTTPLSAYRELVHCYSERRKQDASCIFEPEIGANGEITTVAERKFEKGLRTSRQQKKGLGVFLVTKKLLLLVGEAKHRTELLKLRRGGHVRVDRGARRASRRSGNRIGGARGARGRS